MDNLNKLEHSVSKLTEFFNEVINDKSLHPYLIKRLRTIKYELEEKIKTEHSIKTQTKEFRIPLFRDSENYKIVKVDEIMYCLKSFKRDSDDSFHLWSYAYIPNGDGYIQLLVRMLGNDAYGDRIFTEATYFKTYDDDYGYYSKDYGKNKRYPKKFDTYVDFIINEFNKLPEVNGSFKPFK